jgi:hypothetical protein
VRPPSHQGRVDREAIGVGLTNKAEGRVPTPLLRSHPPLREGGLTISASLSRPAPAAARRDGAQSRGPRETIVSRAGFNKSRHEAKPHGLDVQIATTENLTDKVEA